MKIGKRSWVGVGASRARASSTPKVGASKTGLAPVRFEASKAPALIAPHALRLSNPDGQIITVPATNYYVDPANAPRPVVADIAKLVLSRSAEAQRALGQKITRAHADAEMSFRVKDPNTGAYDKVFEVPCHPAPVPLEKQHFDLLVESTGSVMRALREMLQAIYSNPNATAEDLGLGDVPEEERERVLETVRGSVYFEPKLVDANMADYPFLTVGGFDAAVGDLDAPQPIFFEFNLGTPSGLSNNIQLQEVLRELDPEMYATLKDRLPEDDTFGILRRAIESNARAWTKRGDGIAVVVGPGVANGAHPDVASIAHYSGMPLVNPSDLYRDADGAIRLNTPEQSPHPVVTGIYGRMEESYFLQDSKKGLPIRDPHLVDHEALSERLGVKLEPGIVYAFEYDDDDEIVGVKKDADGKPMLQPVFEAIGRDPARPDVAPGSFADAIKERQLYYSGLGGRVVDDKRVFQVISRYLAPKFTRRADEPIARPPRTLDVSEYPSFYDSDDLTKFVVKAPDRSGGDGVMLMCNLSEQKRRAVVEEVKADPSHFIVQELVPSAVMLAPERGADGTLGLGSLMTDWRLFTMMDADGNVDAGPNALLLRVASAASASTNTSQGGGYGIGVVLDEPGHGAARGAHDSLLPPAPTHAHLTDSKRADLSAWLDLFEMVLQWSDPEVGGTLDRIGNTTFLADRQRMVMELIGRDFAAIMPALRRFDKGEGDRDSVHLALLELRDRLLAHDDFPVAGVKALVQERLGGYEPLPTMAANGPRPLPRDALLAKLSLTPLAEPVELYSVTSGASKIVTYDVATYGDSSPALRAANAKLAAFGGEVRFVRSKRDGEWTDEPAPAYFRIDDGVPYIGVDMSQPFAMSALAHQMAYFEVFAETVQAKERDGTPRAIAAKLAGTAMNTPTTWARAERRGIKAEIATDVADTSEFNRGDFFRAKAPQDAGYVARAGHADVEAVRSRLFDSVIVGRPSDRAASLDHIHRLMSLAERSKKARLSFLEGRLAASARTTTAAARLTRLRDRASIAALQKKSLFDQCFDPFAQQRFGDDGTLDALRSLFDGALKNRGPSSRSAPLFEAPEHVRTGRDSIDDALEHERIPVAARILLTGLSLATAGSYMLGTSPVMQIQVQQLETVQTQTSGGADGR